MRCTSCRRCCCGWWRSGASAGGSGAGSGVVARLVEAGLPPPRPSPASGGGRSLDVLKALALSLALPRGRGREWGVAGGSDREAVALLLPPLAGEGRDGGLDAPPEPPLSPRAPPVAACGSGPRPRRSR